MINTEAEEIDVFLASVLAEATVAAMYLAGKKDEVMTILELGKITASQQEVIRAAGFHLILLQLKDTAVNFSDIELQIANLLSEGIITEENVVKLRKIRENTNTVVIDINELPNDPVEPPVAPIEPDANPILQEPPVRVANSAADIAASNVYLRRRADDHDWGLPVPEKDYTDGSAAVVDTYKKVTVPDYGNEGSVDAETWFGSLEVAEIAKKKPKTSIRGRLAIMLAAFSITVAGYAAMKSENKPNRDDGSYANKAKATQVAEAPAPVAAPKLVEKPEPVNVLEPVEVEAPVEVAPEPVKVEAPVVVAPEPVKVEAPVEVAEPVKVEAPVEVAEPVKVEAPVEVAEPVKVEAPVVVEPVEVEAPVAVEPVEVEAPVEVAPEPVKVEAPVVVEPVKVETPATLNEIVTYIQLKANGEVDLKATKATLGHLGQKYLSVGRDAQGLHVYIEIYRKRCRVSLETTDQTKITKNMATVVPDCE